MSVFASRKKARFVADERSTFLHLKKNRFEYGGVPQRDVRSTHMSVSGGAALVENQGIDNRPLDSRVKRNYDEQGRFVKHRSGMVNPVNRLSREGIRKSTALGLTAAIVLVLLCMAVFSFSQISAQESTLRSLRVNIARYQERNDSLREQYESAQSELNIAYNAKDLGLVSSKSLSVTRLYAPMNAQISPADSLVLPSDTLAVILGY